MRIYGYELFDPGPFQFIGNKLSVPNKGFLVAQVIKENTAIFIQLGIIKKVFLGRSQNVCDVLQDTVKPLLLRSEETAPLPSGEEEERTGWFLHIL